MRVARYVLACANLRVFVVRFLGRGAGTFVPAPLPGSRGFLSICHGLLGHAADTVYGIRLHEGPILSFPADI